MSIKIDTVLVGPYQMNCYIVENISTKEVIIVDPGADPQKIIEQVGTRKPQAILLTHGHYDHIGAVDNLCNALNIPLYIHSKDADKLPDPTKNESASFQMDVVVKTKPLLVEDNQTLHLAGFDIKVIHTPGHTKGGVCYLLPENQGLLCGDTLFDGGYGRYDFYDGDFSELKQSLRKILFMTPKMVAYPGHGSSTFAGKDVGDK